MDRRRILLAAAAVLLLGLCTEAILKYAGWSGSYSALYGLASETQPVKTAHGWALFYFWVVIVLEGLTTGFVSLVLPRRFPELHFAARWMIRGLAAAFIVVSVTVTAAVGLSIVASHVP
jgi:hypothetical protein